MSPRSERRLLQLAIALAAIVPVAAGLWGVAGGIDSPAPGLNTHVRYLSGLLLGIGLTFLWSVPSIERRGAIVRPLTVIIGIGGVARLITALHSQVWSPPVVLPLIMELGITPLIAAWRERIERRTKTALESR